MITPLFGFSGGQTLGLNGIGNALNLQTQQLALEQAVRNNARDFISFSSELDQLGQFADFRQQGLTPAQSLLQISQGSVNPLTAQAGLNNYINRSGLLAPLGIEQARQGNPALINSLSPGFTFDPNNPTSGFGFFGAQGIGQQTTANLQNNLSGGRLFNTPAPAAPAPAPAPVQTPQIGTGRINPNQFTQPAQQNQTRIQQNAEIVRQVQEATQPRVQPIPTVNTVRPTLRSVANPQTERLEAVTFPTVDTTRGIRAQADAQRNARSLLGTGFTSIYGGI